MVNQKKLRHGAIGGVTALVIAGALALGGASAANAGYGGILGPRNVVVFPTWGWGASTTFCARNIESTPGKYAKVRITPTSNPWVFDDVYANPGQTTCIQRAWWGAPIVANNLSTTGAHVEVWTR